MSDASLEITPLTVAVAAAQGGQACNGGNMTLHAVKPMRVNCGRDTYQSGAGVKPDGRDGSVIFMVGQEKVPTLELRGDGVILVRGRPVTKDLEVFAAVKAWSRHLFAPHFQDNARQVKARRNHRRSR